MSSPPLPQPATPMLALAVNLARKWPAVESGSQSAEQATLGDWFPWKGRSTSRRLFDPDDVAVIIGCVAGRTRTVFDVVPDTDGSRFRWVDGDRRLRFHGLPSQRFRAQLGAPAPMWQRGELTPLKVMPLDELLDTWASAPRRRALVGSAVVTLTGDGQLHVSVPADYTVTISTRPSPDDAEQ